ncbi:GerAB/ArcD/ProY family transporter [Laceyella putida]|uniref:Endospore germination permease n=1 Tax=Laceyella putida TaxID=110101 RepID=A0ABW2RN46_9BACL
MNKLRPEPDSNQTISPYQAFAVVFSSMVGVGVLSLPRDVGQFTGNDMLWVIVLSGLFVWVVSALISWLCRRFPAMSVVQFAPIILGREKSDRVGKLLSVPFLLAVVLFWVGGIAISTRVFGEVVVTAVLVNTPIEAIMLVFLVAGAFAAGSHPAVIAKFNEFLLPTMFVPILLYVISIVQRGEMMNLFPLFQTNWMMVLKGVLSASYSYAGYKVIMMFSGFYAKPDKGFKAHSAAVLAATFIYWFTCLTSLSVFGKDEISKILVPVLEVVKAINLKALVFERLESAILGIWLIAVFTTIVNLQTSFVQMVMEFFRLRERTRRWVSLLMVPVLYRLAVLPSNVKQVGTYASWMGIYSLAVAIIVPGILLIISLIRKKKGGAQIEASSAQGRA